MVNESEAVLDELGSLAVERGWTRVTDFIASMKQAGPSAVLVAAAPDVDADSLAMWFRSQLNSAPVMVMALDSMADDPGRALAGGRVVITLKAGELLSPADIAATEAILGRPDGSYAIVVTEAERITTEAELATVRRMVAGGVLNQSGTGRGRGWMFWTEQSVPDFLAGPVREDRVALQRWVAAGLEGQAELAFQRASHALSLASDAEGTDASSQDASRGVAPAQTEMNTRRIPALREAVAKLHRRVIDYLDAQSAGLKRELTASLGTMRQDLLHDLDSSRSRDPEAQTGLVREHISRWTEDASRLLMRREDETARGAADMLDVVDWSLVNEVARAFIPEPYPHPISTSLRSAPVILTGGADFTPPAEPSSGRGRGEWTPALRTAAVGGVVVAAAAAALYGIALVPVAGGAALGAAAGTLARVPVGPLARKRHSPDNGVVEAVTAKISSLHALLVGELDEQAATVRQATDAGFEDVERALVRAETTATGPEVVDELPLRQRTLHGDQLARLRTRLAGARPGLSSSGTSPVTGVSRPGVADEPDTAAVAEEKADLPWAAARSSQESATDNRRPWE